MRVRCPKCGEEHDLHRMDIRFHRPDVFVAIPEGERATRTLNGDDACAIRDADGANRRYFLRVALPIPIRGESDPFCWGIWAEVSADAYQRTRDLWDAAEQASEPPFPARLANRITEFAGAEELPGMVQLTGPTSIPRFTIAAEVEHPLATAHREGVYLERVLEWLAARLEH